ncbi:MAG: hypothetical protein ACTSYM_05305 [Candidatus Baldrarchaeia archaeon]
MKGIRLRNLAVSVVDVDSNRYKINVNWELGLVDECVFDYFL